MTLFDIISIFAFNVKCKAVVTVYFSTLTENMGVFIVIFFYTYSILYNFYNHLGKVVNTYDFT